MYAFYMHQCATLVKCYKANFRKPVAKQSSGMVVKYNPEFFSHNDPEKTHFPVGWDDIYEMFNLRALDSSIMRIFSV